ncbi:hypothetical protein [Ancylothrix sp. D3o]|nr:hypothetical protein [Ancylothrix sp. D3o]
MCWPADGVFVVRLGRLRVGRLPVVMELRGLWGDPTQANMGL